jgi:hypothetical protein
MAVDAGCIRLLTRGGGPEQGQNPVRDLGGERDQGRAADHAVGGHDGVEHALQVGVGPGHDPAEHVARARDGVGLQHLGDHGQLRRDGIVAAGLADLERDERGDLITERGRVHVGPVSGDHAAIAHAVQAGLHGAAGDAEPPGGLEHAHPGLGGQQFDERGIQPVDRLRAASGHVVHRYQLSCRKDKQHV